MWPDPHESADLVIFTEELPKRKLHFLCSGLAYIPCCIQFIYGMIKSYIFWAQRAEVEWFNIWKGTSRTTTARDTSWKSVNSIKKYVLGFGKSKLR